MPKGSKNIFQRLTALFKSGPVVKRKIRGFDTAIAVPDSSKSSGALFFQKSFSPTYATITSNAYNLSERLMRYDDFASMEYTPEIAAALDLYADETFASDDKGVAFHVYSENEKIKETLEDLFYNTLNIEFMGRSWARNIVKFGDFFMFIDVHPEQGVINALPIPVNEIEREENYDPNDPFAVRFRWVTLGNRTLENWEVAHFRLLGNDAFLPYGSSVIEPARRIWRQLILIEDAMLVYRVVRAPERRVFYIDVANVPAENVPMYVEEVKKNLRTNQVIDRDQGRVDLRYNPMCHFGNDYIYLCDGSRKTFAELGDNWENHKDNTWVWSLDEDKHVVPSRLIWAGKTIEKTIFAEVELDDGQVLRTTPDHKWMLRDGTLVQAKDLRAGESLMPFYTKVNHKLTNRHGDKENSYINIYDPGSEKYVSAHRLSGLWKYNECDWPNVIHHVNHIKRDNRPDNLQKMTQSEHALLHRDLIISYNKSEKGRSNSRNRMKKTWQQGNIKPETFVQLWKNNEIRQKRVDALTFNIDSRAIGHIGSAIEHLGTTAREHQVRDYLNSNNDFKTYLKSLNSEFKNGFSDKLTKATLLKILRKFNFSNLRDLKDYVASVRAPFDKIVSNAISNNFTTRREIEKAFRLSKYDLIRIIEKNGLTTREFDNRFLSGGYRKNVIHESYDAQEIKLNHKVVSVKITEWEAPAYGATVENSTHIIAVGGSTSTDTTQGGVFVKNSVDEDYFIAVRGNETGTKIDTLAGGQNTAAVEDVEYIQKKLISALKVPRAYLGYEESLSSKATLAQMDIRFSRTISIIQKTIISELNKIAIIHLYANGFDGEDLQNFTLHLSNPSTIAQQQKLELWRTKLEIAGSLPEGYGAPEFVMREIWGLTTEDINLIKKQQVDDAIFKKKLEDYQTGFEEPGGGGAGGGDEGGGDLFGDLGGGGDEASDEGGEDTLPPEENAGDVPEEEQDDSIELLTSAEDFDDDEDFAIKVDLKELDKPIKPKSQLSKSLYNRSRRRTHGSSKTGIPDFKKMTSNNDDDGSMSDPYDNNWLKSTYTNPFGESAKPKRMNVGLSPDIKSTLTSMSTKLGISRSTGILTESQDAIEIDLDIEE
jgi:hypothetical protein